MVPDARPAILCVDDSPAILELLVLRLEDLGYRVLTTDNPDDALRLLADERIAVMIVDYQMPQMNGAILASLAKSLHEDLVVVMLSGSVLGADEDLGAVDRFLAKGDSFAALDHQLSLLLGHPPLPEPLPGDRA